MGEKEKEIKLDLTGPRNPYLEKEFGAGRTGMETRQARGTRTGEEHMQVRRVQTNAQDGERRMRARRTEQKL